MAFRIESYRWARDLPDDDVRVLTRAFNAAWHEADEAVSGSRSAAGLRAALGTIGIGVESLPPCACGQPWVSGLDHTPHVCVTSGLFDPADYAAINAAAEEGSDV